MNPAAFIPSLLLGILLVVPTGCAAETADAPRPTVRLAARKAVPLYGQAPPASEPSDDENKDYWEGVEFGAEDFAEVRRFVKLFYIDPSFDKHLAWITAANFALRSMTKPAELLPEDFLRLRKAGPDAVRYSGAVTKLKNNDPFVLVTIVEDPNERKVATSMTPKQIRLKKKEIRKRQEELDRAFARVPFTEADFERVIDHVRKTEEAANPKFRLAKAWIAAAQGYLASLDPHSTIISAAAWEESTRTTTDGSFEGIGAVLTQKGDETIIETPMEGQPAYKAGLRAGDVIVAVGKQPISGLDLHKVVKKIRGPKGTTVELTIRRLGEPKDLEFSLLREHIEVRNVQARMLDRHPDIGYIKITGFVPTSREAMEAEIAKLEKAAKGSRLRGLVIDMRHNSGGLLQESVDMADDFLDDGVIVSVKNPSDRDEVYRATPGGYKFPVVALVNDSSASAAEILASALQESGRGLVVGDRTFGKASVQTLLNPLLRRDFYIKLTVARYYAPSGRTLQVTGVIPDITIPPAPGEELPVGFREEDLSHHLTKLSGDYVPPNRALVKKVLDCDRKRGIATDILRADPSPQVKADYQLLKAADYLECLVSIQGSTPPAAAAVEPPL